MKQPPRQILKKNLVMKMQKKNKIGGPQVAFFPENLDPHPLGFWQKLELPPWIFNPCASM
jgi:hypothetical protein